MEKMQIVLTFLFFLGLIILFSPIKSDLWNAALFFAIISGAWVWTKSK